MLGLDLLAYVQKGQDPIVCVDRLPKGVCKDILNEKGIHKKKVSNAFDGMIQHYEWSHTEGPSFFQTIMLPLPIAVSGVPTVLITTRNITYWANQNQAPISAVHEALVAHTFSQILLAAREEEKKTLSKSLHDEIGSAAVILTSLLRLIRADVEKDEKKQALSHIKELDVQIKEIVERIKNLVISIRPPSLEYEGALYESIYELLENISHLSQLTYTFDCKKNISEEGVSDRVKILLYRVVQEALNNVVKHAKATHIVVKLARCKEQFQLCIEDNGVGFTPTKQTSIRHIGLLAMKDSVHLLGGTITVKSKKGEGTWIKVICPCTVYEEQL